MQTTVWRKEAWASWEVVDLGVEMVVCCVVRVEEAEVGGEASQGLSRQRMRGLLFV